MFMTRTTSTRRKNHKGGSLRLFRCIVGVVCLSLVVSCSQSLSPDRCYIPDTNGAKYFTCPEYELMIADEGHKGYIRIMTLVRSHVVDSTLNPGALTVCLRCLASFHNTYDRLGGIGNSRCFEITEVLHKLLTSRQRTDRQVAVTSMFYDFDIYDDETIRLLRTLQLEDDVYTARFAWLSLEKIHKRIGLDPLEPMGTNILFDIKKKNN
jgi:hypothetical protein